MSQNRTSNNKPGKNSAQAWGRRVKHQCSSIRSLFFQIPLFAYHSNSFKRAKLFTYSARYALKAQLDCFRHYLWLWIKLSSQACILRVTRCEFCSFVGLFLVMCLLTAEIKSVRGDRKKKQDNFDIGQWECTRTFSDDTAGLQVFLAHTHSNFTLGIQIKWKQERPSIISYAADTCNYADENAWRECNNLQLHHIFGENVQVILSYTYVWICTRDCV